MSLFLSTHINPIDRKGRVSVPAGFRTVVAHEAFQGVVLLRSPALPALEGMPYRVLEDMAERLEQYAFLSSDQSDLAATLFADSVPLSFDGEGRITLPTQLMEAANIKTHACFVGLGRTFQVWEPGAWTERRAEAQAGVRTRGLTLPPRPQGGGT